MDIIKEVNDLLIDQDHQERMSKLSVLADVFEYHRDVNREEIIEGVKLLLVPALQEKDKYVKEAFFDAINAAVIHRDIGYFINWDMLVDALPSLEKEPLGYALNILSASGQERYLPMLDGFTQDADPDIREDAQEAIRDIKYWLTRSTAVQNKEE
jgi:hypothetical protein